ncbi:pre-mRNA-splicing factor 38A, putative [Plasmodium malariae]|uniref:Pre-mRNA-splicing factor 38 n=1 Tax=Plasmodium malariae TaxID=5858 RepID=A0A1A8WTA1_PLAMA|nr:pre-mRNA-splicing factor 38A, putative [Plasmodium malariae]SBS95549.1 pre-mRNA-splicing factor 38A, putative [Plasmodium malariae]SCN12843.1 pre-mRNA-splicing factor 38A, putative [Plasmodium malariae]
MANRTDASAIKIFGSNPQYLISNIIRSKIYESPYWKEKCFALTSESIIDQAVNLKYVGGTYGGNRKPTRFLCLVLKLLQIQPDKDIIYEYIKNEEFIYLRALGIFYLRLIGKSLEIYKNLEPILFDYRKIRMRSNDGTFQKIYMDVFVDNCLVLNNLFDVDFPTLTKRQVLEENNLLEKINLEYYKELLNVPSDREGGKQGNEMEMKKMKRNEDDCTSRSNEENLKLKLRNTYRKSRMDSVERHKARKRRGKKYDHENEGRQEKRGIRRREKSGKKDQEWERRRIKRRSRSRSISSGNSSGISRSRSRSIISGNSSGISRSRTRSIISGNSSGRSRSISISSGNSSGRSRSISISSGSSRARSRSIISGSSGGRRRNRSIKSCSSSRRSVSRKDKKKSQKKYAWYKYKKKQYSSEGEKMRTSLELYAVSKKKRNRRMSEDIDEEKKHRKKKKRRNIKNENIKNENTKNENTKNENIKNENIKNENIKNENKKNDGSSYDENKKDGLPIDKWNQIRKELGMKPLK